MIILVPLLAAVLGLLLYVLASNPKLQEIGRLTYFAGILVTLFEVAPRMVSFLK
jgi:hypothetical protein